PDSREGPGAVGWMDRWAARIQRKSDQRVARWQERQQERVGSGRVTVVDRWVARVQRKSDERVARWQRPPRPRYRPPRWFIVRGLGFLVISIAGLVIGPYGDAHHIEVLNQLGLIMVPMGFVIGISSLIKARRLRRQVRKITKDVLQEHPDKD
ncbi:MAG TPA: hypothetical protein VF482_01125, partial [Trebonia sp.]